MTESAGQKAAESSPAEAPDPAVVARSGERVADAGEGNGAAGVVVPTAETGACVVLDVGPFGGGGTGDDGSDGEGGNVCRICQLSAVSGEDASEPIPLGCECKGELGFAHRQCAEAWFKVRGNRCCEICGSNAKNITVRVDLRFIEEGLDRRELNGQNLSENNERLAWWKRLPFCNSLMGCLIITFVLLWFFRVTML
ncbi:putative E3 ubiquitin ligase SUD1 [Canna indica]|uniref:E3 ubiquitin ligase SUD1 n=1 Tax=Canna indica TaxID=4628 RepID=A0AAQ3K246_9LILI|nr:putative E3 ubiquitin ligase SUD1 [Canna indica]